MTWNIYWGLGYPPSFGRALSYFWTRKDRKVIEKIVSVVRQENPDVLVLNEIDNGSLRNGKYSHVKEIKQKTKMNGMFAPERDLLGYLNDGNVVLTKKKAVMSVRELPRNIEPRNCIRADCETYQIIGTHFGAHNINEKERIRQAKEVVSMIGTGPTIVLGDLNCEPGDAPFTILEKAGLRKLHDKPTYPAHDPKKSFDHILVTEHFTEKSVRVLSEKHSDHLAVVAELEFRS